MRRGVLLLVTWLIGSLAATTLAWAAVGVVRRNVTDRRVAALSPRAVSEALDATPNTEPATSTTLLPGETTTTLAGGGTPGGPSSTTTTTRRGQRPGGGTPTTISTTGGPGGTSSGGSTTGTGGGSNPSSPTTSTTARPIHFFSIVRADGTVIGQGSFSCNGDVVEDHFAAPAQGWNGPHDYSQSTPQQWGFEIDSNSGGRKTKVTVSCPGGNSRVDETDLDNNG